jgi:glutamyl-tRNA reductase
MNLVLVGLNHRTAPVEVRERLSFDESRLTAALAELIRREGILEALIISTCNRVEVAISARDLMQADPIVRDFLSHYHRRDANEYEHYLYWYRQEDVVRHLFRVASSLDSMILGEPQVLGQMKQAYAAARSVGALNGTLNDVVNQALAVARRIRRETGIGATAVSISHAAVELAKKILGSLEGKTIFVIGAGEMSELAVRHLLRSGATAIFVSNRTYDHAQEFAKAFHGTAIRFEDRFDHIDKADVIISSTGASHFVVRRDQVEQLLAARKNRPMVFVDIAVPRDIDPSISSELGNAFVYDIDDLGQVVDANRQQREREAVWAERIVDQEVQKTLRRLASRNLAPTIVALEERLNCIREVETNRFRQRLSSLSPEQRNAVDALTRGILNKILHRPITELKGEAGNPEKGALVNLTRKIFGLEEAQGSI